MIGCKVEWITTLEARYERESKIGIKTYAESLLELNAIEVFAPFIALMNRVIAAMNSLLKKFAVPIIEFSYICNDACRLSYNMLILCTLSA